jgi:hypothetical protein
MGRKTGPVRAGLAFVYLATLSIAGLVPAPASAVVYCKAVGIPKGCVVRPPVAAVIYCTAPGVPVGCVVRPRTATAIYCTAPGVPVGCRPHPVAVAPRVGAPGVGVVGTPMNRGGPVNRVGRR